mgnify:CR=1 FL=1
MFIPSAQESSSTQVAQTSTEPVVDQLGVPTSTRTSTVGVAVDELDTLLSAVQLTDSDCVNSSKPDCTPEQSMVLTTTGTAAVLLLDPGCVNSSKPDCAPEEGKLITTTSVSLLRESETSVAAVAIQEQEQEQEVVIVPQLPAERAIGSFRHALRTGKVSIYSLPLPSVRICADCNVALYIEKACTSRLSSARHTVKDYPVTWYIIVNAYPVTWYIIVKAYPVTWYTTINAYPVTRYTTIKAYPVTWYTLACYCCYYYKCY